ncbi:ABC transporter ATP-binding protein [Corallococcus sp. ZKHCc1 1396]|uniref:ABC transporter ATP-binding protein n=1 Tax=Corallococcus soli TaxID=2710757 RepID=A0ABR9PWF9_9BACT|nr:MULTISPECIES: ABC transporter ATP-binding protein [Corallococcus]MBE4752267.1 ABC transporter ATP-binding protein [Corallococcus soli]MCY1029900.1 ABC transporter ATP-binding protein [Corallococcus sp. BB11-1]
MVRRLIERLRGLRKVAPRLLRPANVKADRAKISIAQLGHRFSNKVVALQDVNLNVRSGEFVCLLGPSGCGKSTLLYALAGHVAPTGGTVSIDGRSIQGPGPDRLLMFQEAALFPWLTVRGNITFALGARGVPRSERRERADTFIQRVRLEGFADSLPHELSGGMKMRASLARALAVDPTVLLMDEPFGALDAQTRVHMQEMLQAIWLRSGKTVVFVTHDVQEALMLGTRVVLMAPRPGRVVEDLEIHLPMPRSLEDPSLDAMARDIRHRLRAVEGPALEARRVEPLHPRTQTPSSLPRPSVVTGR